MKHGEKEYLKKIGPEGQKHAFNKPFSDIFCGRYLIDIGLIMSFLPPPPARLIDIGCGTGWTSVFFAKRGYNVIGVDICEDAIKLAEQNKVRYNVENVKFIVADYENITKEDFGEFDCAVFYDSLHHAENEFLALDCVFKILKENSLCILAEPGKFHSVHKNSLRAVELYNVNEKDMHPRKIIKIAKKIGFKEYKILLKGDFILDVCSILYRSNIKTIIKLIKLIKLILKFMLLRKYISSIVILKKWNIYYLEDVIKEKLIIV